MKLLGTLIAIAGICIGGGAAIAIGLWVTGDAGCWWAVAFPLAAVLFVVSVGDGVRIGGGIAISAIWVLVGGGVVWGLVATKSLWYLFGLLISVVVTVVIAASSCSVEGVRLPQPCCWWRRWL
ncbi:hypothetical protein CMI37_16280 [Candidatus Pacearchaeota archaeon]|nr:hypothetical protein [Candidatus Pacearchaeota archaeon]|tara:strand:+ start:4080 stop:4448 length:369 start_codon:yes stop_codon:yes gene_type:complete